MRLQRSQRPHLLPSGSSFPQSLQRIRGTFGFRVLKIGAVFKAIRDSLSQPTPRPGVPIPPFLDGFVARKGIGFIFTGFGTGSEATIARASSSCSLVQPRHLT